MRVVRLFSLVLLISFVFAIMFLDMTKSYSAVAKALVKNMKPVPASVMSVK